jgi:acyl-CoA reductase-like NAD-dependent aldehyde dehydrogenase
MCAPRRDETANIQDAAKKIVWGAMAWGGQWCTSPGFAYVHEPFAEQVVAEARAALIGIFGENLKSKFRLFASHQRARSYAPVVASSHRRVAGAWRKSRQIRRGWPCCTGGM